MADDAACRYSEEHVQILFNLSSDAHLMFDGGGISDCNAAALHMLGYDKRADIVGLHPAVLSPEFQPDGSRSDEKSARMDGLARQRGKHRFEWLHRRRTGESFPVEVVLTHVPLPGRSQFLCVWHDLTERKQHEQMLQAARTEAEVASQAKSEFLATVSEELREPIHGLLSIARLLSATTLSSDQHEYAGQISKIGQSLLSVLNSVLDLSNIETGRLSLEQGTFDIRLAAEDVVDLLTPKADNKGIDLVLRYSPDLPRRGVGDSGRFRQILIGLVENAVQFTDRGHVVLELTGQPQKGNRLSITGIVRNTSSGVSQERLPGMFFAPVAKDRPVSTISKTGLGLAIVKSLLGLMSGEVESFTENENGSELVFSINLGLDESEWPSRLPPASIVGKRIMVLDKSQVIGQSLRAVLERWGFEASTVEDASEALLQIADADIAERPFWCVLVSTEISGTDWESFAQQCSEAHWKNPPLRVLLARSTAMPTRVEVSRFGYLNVIARNVRHLKLLDVLCEIAGESDGASPTTATDGRQGKPFGRVLLAEPNSDARKQILAWLQQFSLAYDLAETSEEVVTRVAAERYEAVLAGSLLSIGAAKAGIESFCAARKVLLLEILPDDPTTQPEGIPTLARDSTAVKISLSRLSRSLATWAKSLPSTHEACFDQERVLALCGNDFPMFAELAGDFRVRSGTLLQQLMEYAGQQNYARTQSCANEIRRSARLFSAEPLEGAARRLSSTADLLDWGAVPACISAVRLELTRLLSQLPYFIRSEANSEGSSTGTQC